MLEKNVMSKCFRCLIEQGYKLFYGRTNSYFLRLSDGVLIKIGLGSQNDKLGLSVLKCNPSEFSANETISSLNEFQIEYTYVVQYDVNKAEGSLNSLNQYLLKNYSIIVFNRSLFDVFKPHGVELIKLFKFKTVITRNGELSEDLSLWNEYFILKINRNYHDFFIGCAVLKYSIINEKIVPCEVIPLELLLCNEERKLFTADDLSDQGQQLFFSFLVNKLIEKKEVLLENIKNDELDWRPVPSHPLGLNVIEIEKGD
jgi:hypothetical protein